MFVRSESNFADGLEGMICLRGVFSGCLKGARNEPCEGCHNPELWDFSYCELKEEAEAFSEFERQLELWKKSGCRFDAISLVGGEPLDQSEKTMRLFFEKTDLFFPGLPVILYTGYTAGEIISLRKKAALFWERATYIKCGPFIQRLSSKADADAERYCYDGRKIPALASVNQEFFKIR